MRQLKIIVFVLYALTYVGSLHAATITFNEPTGASQGDVLCNKSSCPDDDSLFNETDAPSVTTAWTYFTDNANCTLNGYGVLSCDSIPQTVGIYLSDGTTWQELLTVNVPSNGCTGALFPSVITQVITPVVEATICD